MGTFVLIRPAQTFYERINLAQFQDLIGMFAGSICMVIDISGDLSFRVLLERVRAVALGAYEHQEFPITRIAEEQGLGNVSLSTLFPTVLSHVQGDLPPVETSGDVDVWKIVGPQPPDWYNRFGLIWSRVPEGMSAGFVFNDDQFQHTAITSMLVHLETLVQGIIRDPEQRISDLPLLTTAERQQVLVEWNSTETETRYDHLVHKLFEECVDRSPDLTRIHRRRASG